MLEPIQSGWVSMIILSLALGWGVLALCLASKCGETIQSEVSQLASVLPVPPTAPPILCAPAIVPAAC
jgi:hypothetical protein